MRDHNGDLLVLGARGKTGAGPSGARSDRAPTPGTNLMSPFSPITPRCRTHYALGRKMANRSVGDGFLLCSLAALTAAHRIAHDELIVLHSSEAESDVERRRQLERLRFLAPMNESHTVCVEHIVTSGEAGPVIVDFALTRQVDLVVLGSPATMLSEQDLQTSTVLQVISGVHCPVLCIPTSRQEKNRTQLAIESENETAAAAASGRRANQNRPISG